MTAATASGKGGLRAWIVWSLSALAFGYAFFQRVSPSAMYTELMRDFEATGAVLGTLSALYFYPYVALQLPLGALLDTFGARRLITGSLVFAAIGSALLATATSLPVAYAGRFLIGAGSAAGFIGSLALAGRWFPANRFAMLAGFAMFFAMMSGMAGQAPLAWLVQAVGWRATIAGAAIFALVLGLAVFAIVRDAPPGETLKAKAAPEDGSFGAGLAAALLNREVWQISVAAMASSGPMLAFGGLWGVPYLVEAYGLSKPQAAFYTSTLLFGWAIGGPVLGWLSDRVGLRKLPILLSLGVLCLCTGALVFLPVLPLGVLVAVIALMGFVGSCMVNGYALAREVTQPAIHGATNGIVNGMTVASGAVLQPVIGWLLDRSWDGTLVDGVRHYSVENFQNAFVSLFLWTLVGFLVSLTLRESRCKPLPPVRLIKVR